MRNLILEILFNKILLVSVVSWFIAQLTKVIIDVFRHKSVNTSLFISTGGMPSSHSAFVMAMSTSIGLKEGFSSSIFALGAVVSLVVMSDAAGVRRDAGKQAEVLNQIILKIENDGVKIDKKLKELLGHTPIEVACGALLGITIAILFG